MINYSDNQKTVEQKLTWKWIRTSALYYLICFFHCGDYDTDDRDSFSMTKKRRIKQGGQIWSMFVLPTQLLIKISGQSYLLYHLHCRIAVDCCLTSTL